MMILNFKFKTKERDRNDGDFEVGQSPPFPISVVSFPFLHHERSNIGKPNIPICSMYGISPTYGPFIMEHLDLS